MVGYPRLLGRCLELHGGVFDNVVVAWADLFSVPVGTSILDALLSAGIAVAYSCCDGVCGTCETRVLSGRPTVLLISDGLDTGDAEILRQAMEDTWADVLVQRRWQRLALLLHPPQPLPQLLLLQAWLLLLFSLPSFVELLF